MSRGLGSMQRLILEALEALEESQRPEFWYDIRGLGILNDQSQPTAAFTASFRRAVYSLEARGLIDTSIALAEFLPSGFWRTGKGSGPRRHLAVRRPLTETDFDAAVEMLVRARRVRAIRYPSWSDRAWLRWYDNPLKWTYVDDLLFTRADELESLGGH